MILWDGIPKLYYEMRVGTLEVHLLSYRRRIDYEMTITTPEQVIKLVIWLENRIAVLKLKELISGPV